MMEMVIRTLVQRNKALIALRRIDLSKEWSFQLTRHRKLRSLNQNALLHKWLHIIAAETGNEMEDVKAAIKELFLPLKQVMIKGQSFPALPSTGDLSTDEMSQLLTRIEAFAATELGIHLPHGDE